MRQWVALGPVGPLCWNEKPVALVGGGPSLKGFDLTKLRDRFFVVAINATILDAPWADAGFSLDRRAMRVWWPRLRTQTMPMYFAIPDHFLVNFDGAPSNNMTFIRRQQGTTFNNWPWMISCGGTSGYGALQLAFKKGAKRIVMFGFDYGSSPEGEWHHNEAHYTFWQSQHNSTWATFARSFESAVLPLKSAGVEVLNASPRSAITCFPRVSHDEALNDPRLCRL